MSFNDAVARIAEIQGVARKPNPIQAATGPTQNFGEVLRSQLQAPSQIAQPQGVPATLSPPTGQVLGLSGQPQLSPLNGLSGQAPLNGLGLQTAPEIAPPAFLSPNPMVNGTLDQASYQSRLRAAEEIAGRFGLKVSSGYRDPEHNARVGGVPNSLHTQGLAFDFTGSLEALNQAKGWAASRPELFQEVLLHNAGSGLHLHLGFRSS